MKVRIYEDEKFINLELSGDSNWFLFQMVANELVETFEIQWKTQADGLDQRYWEFEYRGIILTLHLEHYLGISIFADKSKNQLEKARQILCEIESHFTEWYPPV